jgi:peptide-methionine (S)-S-oxide reductase
MNTHLPPFLGRLLRPFTHSSRLSIAADSPVAANSELALPEGAQRCTVAAGCFWGTEHLYRKHFAGKGLIDTKVGYIGGNLDNPSYYAICGGKTGHAEAAEITFDPSQVSYRQLIEFFYRTHDPTTLNRQGPDTGPQYRSAIYFHNEEQERVARAVTAEAGKQWWHNQGPIVTEIAPAGKWWTAEEYHQKYLNRNPGGYECPSHYLRAFPPLVTDESRI